MAARAPVTWAGARTIEVRALAAASDGGVWATGIEVSPFPKPFLRYYRADGASRCGADGLVQLTNLVERFEKPQAFSVQVDHGGVLVGGLSPTGFFVSRYREADCSPDVQFGINGIAYLPHPRFQTASHVYMTKDPQGRILIGSTMRGGRMVVWRVAASGEVDSSYGVEGLAFIQVTDNFHIGALAADATGALYAGGSVSKTMGFIPAVAKLNADGALAASFGDQGVARLPEISKGTGSVWSLLLDGEKVVIAGNTTDSIAADSWAGNDSFIAALTAQSGQYVPTFATQGWAVWDWGFNGSNMVLAMAKNKKGGYTTCGHIIRGLLKQSITLADFDRDGQPDSTVGWGGRRVLADTELAGDCFAITQTQDGDMVVGGLVERRGYIATVD